MPVNIKWPPKAESVKMLGYVHEMDGKDSPRDIGRSVHLGGNTYYVFGDTFCFDNRKQFVGLTHNTIALCPDLRKPLESRFLFQNHNGKRGLVRDFLPFTAEEEAFNERNKKDMRRVVLWSFGGMIEDTPGCGQGWIYFEVQQTHGAIAEKSWGVGVCRITLGADRMDVRAERVGGYIWTADRKEPSFGVHSTFKDNATNQIYLLGGGPNLQNFLARIPVGADLTQRSNYQYLSASNRWIPSFTNPNSDLKPLLPNTAQGSIMKPSFAPPGKPYMYMGVGWWMQSKFYIAAAPRIEGPWDLSVLCTAGRLNGVSQYRYCIYPHEWSWRPRTGELFCTWNEDGPSRVIGATVKFAIEGTVDDDDEEESGAGTPGVGLMPAVTGGVAKEASSAQESWSTGGSGGGGLQGAFQKFMSAFR